MAMTEFVANVGGQVVDIEPTLEESDEPGDTTMFLRIPVVSETGHEIDDWITDDPDSIDEWFADVAKLHTEWNRHYHGIEPVHGHIVPLGPGNSNAGTR